MDLGDVGRWMIVAGVALAALGVVLVVGHRLGLGRLPGDLSFGSDGVRVYVPLATMLLLSLVLTILVNLFLRR